jgi:hypothetical protein
MIIWRGFGFLVAVIALVALALTEQVSERITSDQQFYQQHGWVALVGMLIAAALTYGLHRLLILQKGRAVIDKETGQEIVLRSDHSLFFVPVKLWPVVFVVLGLVLAVVPRQGVATDGNDAPRITEARGN